MNLLDLFAKITIDTSEYEKGLDSAERKGKEFGDSTEQSGKKVKGLGPLTVATGTLIANGLTKAAGATISFGKDALAASVDYESAFAQVTTIMDETQMSHEDMSKSIQDLSSQMGISAGDIASSVYDVISATGDTANAVSLVENATKLAKGGFAETGDAVGVLTTAINAYGLEMTDATSISDSLITVQNLGVTTVGELSAQMGKAIATGASYGVNLSNLETGYIALTKSGISTAESTTYLSAMMNELGKDGSDVSNILKEKTGKSFGELMEDGMSLGDVLGILNDSVDGNSEALMNLWGSAEAGKAASSIVNQGLDEFNGWLNEVENSAGATQTAYETMSDTTADKMNVLKESFSNLSNEALEPVRAKFEELIPKVTEFIESIDVEAVFNTLSQLAPIIETIAIAIGLVEAAITLYNIVEAIKLAMEVAEVTTLGGLIAAEIAHAAAMAVALAPYLLIVAAIAAVIAIGVLLVKNWDKIKAKCIEIAGVIKEKFTEIKNAISGKLNEAKEAVKTKLNNIKQSFVSHGGGVKGIVAAYMTALKEFWSSGFQALDNITGGKLTAVYNKIKEKMDLAKQKVKSVIDAIVGFFSGAKFSWPKLSLPHFSISPSGWKIGDLLKGSIPHLSISWYAKAMESGYMFNRPTVVPTADGLKGFGDAGAEMVIGKNNLLNMIREATSQNDMGWLVAEIRRSNNELITAMNNLRIYLDSGELVGGTIEKTDRKMGERVMLVERNVLL